MTLIPVDEWLDDTENNPWLPSFVLPRDPAILKIINSSRRYLIGIMDDPAAGFDGYQEEAAGVDKQVQAIWTALVNEYRIQYINPPPAYSRQTQRLRTPSDISGVELAAPASTSRCCSPPASNISASIRSSFC